MRIYIFSCISTSIYLSSFFFFFFCQCRTPLSYIVFRITRQFTLLLYCLALLEDYLALFQLPLPRGTCYKPLLSFRVIKLRSQSHHKGTCRPGFGRRVDSHAGINCRMRSAQDTARSVLSRVGQESGARRVDLQHCWIPYAHCTL
uniref:Uncharacterized protein n=1 Tax=Trypanosoma vivax (strain Y486) TaxID=1055687 RepID=G0TYM3_TRYVY|nr:hypothetical protein TVY486_0704040 [Trypanosoma vivax Y486]